MTEWITRVCIACVALGSLACAADTATVEGDDRGRTLTIHVADGDERALGPSGSAWFLVFLALAVDADGIGEPQPRLLDRWEHSPDFTEWTVHVREGVVWGDGTPVTARDVKFSLEMWTHPDVGYEYPYFDDITILDNQSLRITFPDPPTATIFTYSWLPMIPEHLLSTEELDELFSWPFWVRPVGSGPFRYARHVAGVMTELEPNPDYYGEAPDLDAVILRYGGNALTELLSGNVDVATGITSIQAGRLSDDPSFRLYFNQTNRDTAIVWNHDNPLFEDKEVRRALTLAIDRRELHRLLNYPEDTPVVDVPALRRHYAGGLVPQGLPFAPDQAQAILTDAGWVDTDGDGVREQEGREFRFTLLTTQENADQAVFLEDAFRRVGLAMSIRTEDRSVHRSRLRARDFDATFEDYYYIETFRDFPHTGYRNAAASSLRDGAWFTLDKGEADESLFQLWAIFGEDLPITYLHPRFQIIAAHRRVQGMRDNRWIHDVVEYLSIEDIE